MSTDTKITIETFKAVTRAISHSDNLDVMTNHLAQLLVTALGVKGCAIYVLEPQTKQLEILASFGLSPDYLTKGPLLADKSIAANLDGKPVIVTDVTKDRNIQYPEQARQEGIAAILSLPIAFLKEIIGALRLYHYEVWHVSEQDIDSLQLLAENVGLAMSYTSLCNAMYSIGEVLHAVGGGRGPYRWSDMRGDEEI